MPSPSLTAERVRRDVEVLGRAGLDLRTFVTEVDASLQRALPNVAMCVGTLDPATWLLTGSYKTGVLTDLEAHDHEWGLIEYGDPEPTTFSELRTSSTPAAAMHLLTGGDVRRSPRMDRLMVPAFGFADEARMIAYADGHLWGSVALFRDSTEAPFSEDDVALLSSLSSTFGVAIRAGLLAELAATPPPLPTGAAVVIVGPDDTVQQLSVGAQERLTEILSNEEHDAPAALLSGLVAAARRYAAGLTDRLPSSRVRLRTGQWFVLHASPLAGRDGASGDVVVTIEEARPPEIVPLVVAAFGLTPRERDVTQLVLQGADTKEIAAALHLSAYTVQDHLKSVFDKADVRSRRELLARIYFDQYVPRIGTALGPSGWFAGS